MAHLQYMPGDPRLVDQLVCELKSKGIFDQFRKECIADVDTKPAYQNLRQRVESSVTTFLARQTWKPDLNKNQLREKLRKHILDGNYLEQGVERIVDQVVNPKVASVFIPQVEDLVYNYLGIIRKKTVVAAETSNENLIDNQLLPTDLEAVSPGSVKSNDDKNETMDVEELEEHKMEIDQENTDTKKSSTTDKVDDHDLITDLTQDSEGSIDKSNIPLPSEEIKPENIPPPEYSPPKTKVELEDIQLPREPNLSTDIPLPDEIHKSDTDFFKPINTDDDSSSDSSLRRNMSPLTPIRNFDNENSCDALQGFENDSGDTKNEAGKGPEGFRFTIESSENSSDAVKTEKKETEQSLSYQFNNQVNINTFNTPLYDDSSNSNNLQIDYESDATNKTNNTEVKIAEDDQNSRDFKKDPKPEDKKSSHKSSHRSRDSHKHSSNSKDRRSDSKHSRDKDKRESSKDKKSSKDDSKSKSSHKDRSSDKSDKKDSSRDSSKHRNSSHKSSSSHKDSKSSRSSSSSHRHSSKHLDEKKSSSSSHRDKDKDKGSKDKSSKDKSSSHRSEKNRKSSSGSKSKHEDKDKKDSKKDTDDHYSASGRGNHNRRSTDRDSNDGSSSSKGSHNPSSTKPSDKRSSKATNSKSDNTSTSGDSTSPSDKDSIANDKETKTETKVIQQKPIVRVESHLKMPVSTPARLPFVPDVTLKKPKFAANYEEAKRIVKLQKFLDEEQRRMNQEAALLLEFQANVRPSLSQAYSNISGPEIEFACVATSVEPGQHNVVEIIEEQPISDQNDSQLVITQNDVKEQMENVKYIDEEENHETSQNDMEGIENEMNAVNSALTNNSVQEVMDTVDDVATVVANDVTEVNDDHIQIAMEEMNNEDGASMNDVPTEIINDNQPNEYDRNEQLISVLEEDNERMTAFEVTVVMEDVSESEACIQNDVSDDVINEIQQYVAQSNECNQNDVTNDGVNNIKQEDAENEKYTQNDVSDDVINDIKEHLSDDKQSNQNDFTDDVLNEIKQCCPNENPLEFFAEHEKYNAELERERFEKFLKTFTELISTKTKMFLVNCDLHKTNIIKEIAKTFGHFDVVNYYKNGHLKQQLTKKIVKDVNLAAEITLPAESERNLYVDDAKSVFSPVKSECSFELSSDYDAKLEEMVNKTSRQEVMEIILGGIMPDDSPTKMPKIDYFAEYKMADAGDVSFKRKLDEMESAENNNTNILTPAKIRKSSDSDQITSTTTEEGVEMIVNNKMTANNVRSKFIGKARRVGLARPKRSNVADSPSSDQSVENYEQNSVGTLGHTPNGKLGTPGTPRAKVPQRYDTSDLYKPKLHYLSRRNHVT